MNLAEYVMEHGPLASGAVWDGVQNALPPERVTPGSHKKVWWRCEAGHTWQAPVHSVALDGCGCPYCSGRRAIPGKTDLVTAEPELAAQWDYDKNGDTDPRQVLPSAHGKVWWKCSLGHSWQAAPFSRTKERGTGCPYCSGKRVLPGFNDLQTRRPEIACQWHRSLNGKLTPLDVTPGSNKKVWWRCGSGHSWQAAIYSRTRKKAAACPICAGTVKAKSCHPERAQRAEGSSHLYQVQY